MRSLLVMLAGAVMFGCSKDDGPDDPGQITYTLSSDKTEAQVGDRITFTVTSSTGEDVTSQWNMCDETFCFTSNWTVYNEPGTHVVSAHMKADPSFEAQNTLTLTIVGEESGGNSNLTFNPDADYILYTVPEKETVTTYFEPVKFYVREEVDGKVTKEKMLGFRVGLVGSERRSRFATDSDYVCDQTGEMEFDGIYYYVEDGETREIKTINTITLLSKERELDHFSDNYFRRSLIFEWTGTWCQNCPAMAGDISDISNKQLYLDRLVTIALHDGNEDLRFSQNNDACYIGKQAYDIFSYSTMNFGIRGLPSCMLDLDMNLKQEGSDAKSLEALCAAALATIDEGKVPGLKISSSLDNRTLSFTVDVDIRESGEYLLGVYLLEDNLMTPQESVLGGTMMEQNHVLHFALSDDSNNELGLHDMGSIAAGNTRSYSSTFEIPVHEKPADFVMENCQLVYFLVKQDSSKPLGYRCVNAGRPVVLGESSQYDFEPVFI